jgi:endonuclease YncB( thermonuclease family)
MVVLTGVFLLLQMSLVLAAEGQVLKVINGDTFRVEVAGSKGVETVEVNLRCSDAPIASSPFGAESRRYLEKLLHGSASVNFKIQAYCGSENCIEVFAYIPDASQSKITYINTQMIAAGMARNASCRGVYKAAEDQAKAEKKGIWSTTKKIVFDEPVQPVITTGTKKSVSRPVLVKQGTLAPAATVEVDRVERTVTLKSRKMSLNRAINAIDAVSTLPVGLYLFEDQYFPVAMDKVPWYKALQQIITITNLKQVNMNGKIDLYDQFFYYKHIAPFMKLADNGGYINVGSGSRPASVVDDGVTRYVFINDFENSAANARINDSNQSGFVQVHQSGSKAPVHNDGRFEIDNDSVQPVTVAETVPAIKRPVLTPYTGKPVVMESPVTIPPTPEPITVVPALPEPVVAKVAKKEPDVVPAVKSEQKNTESVARDTDSSAKSSVDPDYIQMAILVIVVLVVIFGGIFLSRSAGRRAAKAERSVDSASLGQQTVPVTVDSEPQVDEAYEHEVFEDIAHIASVDETETVVDEVFTSKAETPIEPDGSAEESADQEIAEDRQTDEDEIPEEVQKRPVRKSAKKVTVDEGNFAVTLEDFDRMMNPPKREPRHDCLFEVTCRLDGQTLTGIGLDVSRGGIFIDSKEKFAVGKVLELEFRLEEDDPEPIFCRGAVTWVNERPDPIKPNYPNGFGVCFLELEGATEKIIVDFLGPDAADLAEEDEIDS